MATSSLTLIGSGVVVLGLILRVVALGVIPGNRRPTSGMAWLLLILAAPILGYLGFLFLGRTALGKKRESRQREALIAIRARTEGVVPLPLGADAPAYAASVVALNHNLGSLPALSGNDIEVEPDYRASIERMTAAVGDAER